MSSHKNASFQVQVLNTFHGYRFRKQCVLLSKVHYKIKSTVWTQNAEHLIYLKKGMSMKCALLKEVSFCK